MRRGGRGGTTRRTGEGGRRKTGSTKGDISKKREKPNTRGRKTNVRLPGTQKRGRGVWLGGKVDKIGMAKVNIHRQKWVGGHRLETAGSQTQWEEGGGKNG